MEFPTAIRCNSARVTVWNAWAWLIGLGALVWLVVRRVPRPPRRGAAVSKDFDQVAYWRSRHERLRGDPRSVGNLGLSAEENLAGERRLRLIVERAAELLKPAASVLDIGCGYGRVSSCFTEKGYDYLGVDLSHDAIQEAYARNPKARFVTADLGNWDTDERFDVVCALYLFVHFVDDAAWESIVRRSLSWVRPGGAILIADQFPPERIVAGDHVLVRPFDEYGDLLKRSGFTVDHRFTDLLADSDPDLVPQMRHFRIARRGS
jgi:SAM-dependent methyltransferase